MPVAVGVCAGAAPDVNLLQAQEAGMKTKRCAAGSLAADSGGFRREAEASVEGVGGGGIGWHTDEDQDGFYFGKVQAT